MSGIDFKGALNAEQLAAVTAPDGPLLILAAAGTGKTRTLVYRVAHLAEQGMDPSRVLLLTFTNRAAPEMLERAERLVGHGVGAMWGGTFHHMANRMLRRDASCLGFDTDYTILDRDDSRMLMRECMKARDHTTKNFVSPEVLLSISGTSANTGMDVVGAIDRHFKDEPADSAEIMRVLGDYADRKRELGAMDFDDLLANGLKLLKENEDVLARYRDRFVHVLVDEYQDTNKVQAEIVDLLAAGHGNLFVVGDDFQSIYGWRGASIGNILSFKERYPNATEFKLETNYRSTPEILAVANSCIAHNPGQFQKTLRATRPESGSPIYATVMDGEQQAKYVVEQVRGLQREGFKLKDIAVLYRAHFHAMDLQMLLTREGMPYVITSGTRFFEQAHIKDICSIARVCCSAGDELAFRRLVCLLPKVGQKTAQKLWGKLGGEFHVEDAAHRELMCRSLPAAAREPWGGIDEILGAFATENLGEDVGEVMRRFLVSFYGHYAESTFENYEHREDDINELIGYASRFENAEVFLSELALFTNLDGEVKVDDGVDSLRLSTVHQAKGLEWGAVIVLWLVDGMFPSARSLSESGSGESEERRLFYVAVTRAKDVLHLCSPGVRRNSDGALMPCATSRFLVELSPDLFREVWE